MFPQTEYIYIPSLFSMGIGEVVWAKKTLLQSIINRSVIEGLTPLCVLSCRESLGPRLSD